MVRVVVGGAVPLGKEDEDARSDRSPHEGTAVRDEPEAGPQRLLVTVEHRTEPQQLVRGLGLPLVLGCHHVIIHIQHQRDAQALGGQLRVPQIPALVPRAEGAALLVVRAHHLQEQQARRDGLNEAAQQRPKRRRRLGASRPVHTEGSHLERVGAVTVGDGCLKLGELAGNVRGGRHALHVVDLVRGIESLRARRVAAELRQRNPMRRVSHREKSAILCGA